jgi:hypothetical protein
LSISDITALVNLFTLPATVVVVVDDVELDVEEVVVLSAIAS